MMKEIKITYEDDLKMASSLSLANILAFVKDYDCDDLELKFSNYGTTDSLLMEVISYANDIYKSFIVFVDNGNNKNNNDLND